METTLFACVELSASLALAVFCVWASPPPPPPPPAAPATSPVPTAGIPGPLVTKRHVVPEAAGVDPLPAVSSAGHGVPAPTSPRPDKHEPLSSYSDIVR